MSKVSFIDSEQLQELFPSGTPAQDDLVIIDVRTPAEYAQEHIVGSVNLALDDLAHVEKNQFKDKTLVFHCKGGLRTKNNVHLLEMFNSKLSYCLSGGIEQWKACGFKVKN